MTDRLRRYRGTILVAAVVLAIVTLGVMLIGDESRTTADLDPDNPGRNGARAVARVLEDQGIEVTIARGAEALEDTRVDGATTVVVTSTDQLGDSTVRRLRRHAEAGLVIVVEPSPGVVDAYQLDVSPHRVSIDDQVAADCADELLGDLRVEVDRGVAYAGAAGACFDTDHGALYAEPRTGVALLGAGQLLTNDQVTRADNAAVALRLLGQDPRLVWYVPDVRDLEADDAVALRTLLPDWIVPGLWLGLVVLLALVVWRARRLGRLATEPLPVVVKAIETTQSRGRLYRKVNDRGHAAGVLRHAARSRLASRLHLPRTIADQHDRLAVEVARNSGRTVAEVAALISPRGPAPGSDQDLISLAQQLAELEREVSQRR